MEKYNREAQTNNINSLDLNSETQSVDNKEMIEMNENQPQAENNNESAAFEQVMAQLNIADINTFNTRYEQLWFQASENKEMLSIMICEIDSFNAYNEHYGHQATSFMLVLVALELKKKCEEFGGFLARYKTGKFAVLIKKGNINTVEAMAESLRISIEQTNTEHKASTVSDVVTLSIGTSNIYPTSMDVLINKADTALQSSKVSGNKQTILPFVAETKMPDITPIPITKEPIKQVQLLQENEPQTMAPTLIKTSEEVEKVDQQTIAPEKKTLLSKNNNIQDDDFDMISQLKGITPSSTAADFEQENKPVEKGGLFSRFKKKAPSPAKSSETNNKPDSADLQAQEGKEKSEYDHLKAELEALKRKSEDPPPAATIPTRYY